MARIRAANAVQNILLLIKAGFLAVFGFILITASPSSSSIVNWTVGGILLFMFVMVVAYVLYKWNDFTGMWGFWGPY